MVDLKQQIQKNYQFSKQRGNSFIEKVELHKSRALLEIKGWDSLDTLI